MVTLNLGVLAHVDAGKTTLTERLLFAAGVIDKMGAVDAGTTQTDSMALERRRGITIKSAVVSFEMNGVTVNLIDTPGHPDFIAEVERVLSVLDGAILVISAVEGVQAQTRILMRTLRRLRVPTLIFINKLDRSGASAVRVLQEISTKLTPSVVAMGTPEKEGTRAPGFRPYGSGDSKFAARLLDVLAEHDDDLLAAYLSDTPIPYGVLRESLARQTGLAVVHPVFFGSAAAGVGLEPLMLGVTELLPVFQGDPDGPLVGSVFKVDREPGGGKIAYAAVRSGSIHAREDVHHGADRRGKVTALRVFERGGLITSRTVTAGHIAQLSGLGDIRIGDSLGDQPGSVERHFPPPSLETVVVPRRRADKGALHRALTQLAEQDPLINVRQDDLRQEISVSLYGEVQKEVIQSTLAEEYGVEVTFRNTAPVCVERPIAAGESVETLGKAENPYVATVGIRIEPAPVAGGNEVRTPISIDGIPIHVYKDAGSFRAAIEGTARETLEEGIHGWQVIDCIVTMTESGYTPATIAKDFRLLVPLVLMDALQRAGTVVCEPIERFHLDIPADTLGQVLPALTSFRAVPQTTAAHGSVSSVDGDIPAIEMHLLQRQLASLTRGEGILQSEFSHYQAVRGDTPPSRPRRKISPLERREYIRHHPRGL